MRQTSVCRLLLLCVLLYVDNAGSSSHHVQRRANLPTKNHSAIMVPQLTVSPSWYLSVGDTVEINCTMFADMGNYSDKINLQLVWTKMNLTTEVLVSRRASKGISYVLGPVTHEHQGVYSCGGDGSLPDIFVFEWHKRIWVADTPPLRASIDVSSHNRNQFLNGETFTLSCQLPDNNAQWKMRRFDDKEGTITDCPSPVFSDHRLSCTFNPQYPSNAPYWCESPAGERSNALNVTNSSGTNVVLESPTLPVLEGDDVTLRCLHRKSTTGEITSFNRALFYKNHFLKYEVDGTVTLKAVTKADEGFYKCRHLNDGYSNVSWISVIARSSEDQKNQPDVKTS
uniref:uncharacterized protein LOC124054313 n=1 Tax=Scatophagus argus TaxID=75038 RepID=UPI001ED823E3|nr:uncharacterized protein LOC124054313 [Scatophagus argus]